MIKNGEIVKMSNLIGIIIYAGLSISLLISIYVNDKQDEIIKQQQDLIDEIMKEWKKINERNENI